MLTALYLYGGTVCALMSLGLIVAVVGGAWRESVKTLAGVAAMVLPGAVAGLWLPFIHVKEVDVAAAGFRQARYVTGTKEGLTFYNATSSPVTICLGSHGTCRSGSTGGPLPASGLTLRPGHTADVSFPDEGIYPLTIVAPVTTMTVTDTVVQSLPPYCDENSSAQACICGTQGC